MVSHRYNISDKKKLYMENKPLKNLSIEIHQIFAAQFSWKWEFFLVIAPRCMKVKRFASFY